MSLTVPETGRITLTLKADTIKALRLLALLKGESQNDVAETLLIAGGLHNAVDCQWNAGKLAEVPVSVPEPPVAPLTIPVFQAAPVPPSPLQKPSAAPAAPSPTSQPPCLVTPQTAPVQVKPAPMSEVKKVVPDEEVSPYMKD